MRKYSLADSSKRGKVDLRDYKDIIEAAVQEFAPGNKVVVTTDYYIVEVSFPKVRQSRLAERYVNLTSNIIV